MTRDELNEYFEKELLTGPEDACPCDDCIFTKNHSGSCYLIASLHAPENGEEDNRQVMRSLRNGE